MSETPGEAVPEVQADEAVGSSGGLADEGDEGDEGGSGVTQIIPDGHELTLRGRLRLAALVPWPDGLIPRLCLIEDVFNVLGGRQRQAVAAVYGIHDADPMSSGKAAKLLGTLKNKIDKDLAAAHTTMARAAAAAEQAHAERDHAESSIVEGIKEAFSRMTAVSIPVIMGGGQPAPASGDAAAGPK